MGPRNEPNSNLVNWIIGFLLTLIIGIVIVITGIFFIRKKRRNGNLAFIDDNLQPPHSYFDDSTNASASGNEVGNLHSYFDDSTNASSGNEVGNLENTGRPRFGHGLFSIYCRSCYSMIDRRRQNTPSLNLNCVRGNSDRQDEQRILQTDEGTEEA